MLTPQELAGIGVDTTPKPAPAAPVSQSPDGSFAYGVDVAQQMAGRGVQATGGALREAGADRLGGWIERAGQGIVEQQNQDIAAGGYRPKYEGGFLDQPGILPKIGWVSEKVAENAASSIPMLAGGAAVALAGASSPLLAGGALALGGGAGLLMNAGETAQELDDKGVSSNAAALAGGAIKTGLDLVGSKLVSKPLEAVGRRLAGKSAGEGAGSLAGSILRGGAAEGLTEGAQDTTDKAIAAARGASYTPGEVGTGFLESGLVGGAMGGVASGIEHAGAKLTTPKEQAKQKTSGQSGAAAVPGMSDAEVAAARAAVEAGMQRSAERQSMRDGSAAAQENALVPYNEAGPWRRFSEAAGPGQTTNQGFRGGMLPGPAPDFIEGEFSDVTGQPQATGFGGPGFEQQIRPQAAGAAGMIGPWPAEPAPVAPSAPTDLLALPAPSLAPAAGPAPDYYMPPAIGPLTTAVRAAVSQQQAGAPTSIAGLLPAPVAAPVATAPAATTAAPALPQMPYPRPALPALAGSAAPSIPATTPVQQPQPQEASHVQGQRQTETEALLSGAQSAGTAAAQPAAAPAPIKTERAAKAAAARKSKSTGKPHEAVAVDGGWQVQPEQARSEPPVAPPKPRKPVRIDERKDTLLTAIAKAGGLSREEAAAHGIDPADFRRASGVFGRPVFRKTGGLTFDEMAEALHQHGYPVADERGNYSPNVLLDRIGDELRGRPVRTHQGVEAQAERDAADREATRQQDDFADAYGLTSDPFEFSDAELEASGYADADESTRRVAEIIAEAKTRIDSDIVEDIAERVATQTDARGATDEEFIAELEAALRGQETNDAAGQARGNPDRTDAGSDAQGEDFALGGYSEADIARREAEAVASRAREEKARKAAEDRARAERDRGQFELTGSDRPADANPRQSDLLDLTGRPGSAPAADSPRKSDVAEPAPAAGQPVEPAAEPVKAADGYGASNTLFTADAAEQARALLRKKLGQLSAGLDPEIVQAGITLAGYHIEAGARSFAAYTKAMIADLGEAARPYLRSWYEGVRYYPGMDATGMTPAAEIDALQDVPASDAAAAAPEPLPESVPAPEPAKTRSAPKERTQKEQKAKPAIISGYSDQHPEWVKYWEEKSVGRTVYSNATEGIALMEGSSLLTGAPVYTAIMRSGELSARVDIDSYTGRDLTEAQRAELSQAKQRHVEFDAREHAARPDGPFKDGERFAYSGDIPAKVAGVARDWLKLAGIDARVFLTTEHGTRGKSDQYGLYGPFAPIRSAAFSPEEGGSTRKLSNGDHYIVLSKQVLDNATQWPETLAHEIGHVLEKVAYQQADVATKNAIIGAYNRWITHQKTGGPGGGIVSMEDLVRNVRAASMAEAAIASARERGIDTSLPASEMSNAGYFSSFSEWFADQVSRWAVSSETPQTAIGRFFKAIANKLRKLYAAAAGKRYLPSDEMKAWLDARAAANPLQGAAPEGATNDTAGTTGSSEGDSQVDDGQRPGAGKAAAGSYAGARRGAGRSDDRSVSGEGGGASDATAAAGLDGNARKGAGAKVGGGADLARGDGRVSADFRPEPGGLTRSGSWLETASRNLDLIDLARKIESEGRNATAQEQAQLALYVGFGAGEIRNRMFPVPGEYLRRKNPNRLIFPEAVEAGRWRSLAERAAALPEDWQRSILQVTQYQHFTSENVIRSIWSALQRLGFTGGKVFEPGTGIGSFRMLMPESVASTSKFTGIEFDGPTALIARLLSPEQNMLHGDFIKHRMPDDYFDVVIGNPPFSQTQVLADPRYQKHGFMLHDFFFAKSLDKLRPGGVLAFVTSKGTMDKKSDRARRYLADRADLLGAVRLPSTAFEGNAGTSVVTDVIFLRKRAPGDAEGGLPWRDVRTVETKDGPVVINEYFADNPGMVLGQNRISGNQDDEGRRINSNGMGGEKYTVVSYDKTPAELDARFARAVESLPEAVYRPHGQDAQSLRTEAAKADFDPAVKREGVVYVKDGELMRVKDGVGVPLSGLLPKLSAKDTAWLKDYSGVRDLVREAQHAQITDGEWQDALKRLNAAYDDFVSKHGRFTAFRLITRKSTDEDGNVIEKQSRVYINRRLMIEDYDSPIVTQLESIDDDGAISKGPFLKGRSINAPKPRDVRTIGDALAVSLDEIGRLDLDDIARRLRISRDDAIDALGDQVFRTPQGEMQMADEYLSGNVVEKLAEAVEAARLDDSLRRNVEALEKAQPERLGPSQIGVKLGASWVPTEHVNEFASMIGAGYVTFDPKTESWAVEGGNKRSDRKVGAEYGTAARSPSELLEALLNSRSIKVMKTVPSDTGEGTKNVVDAEATTAANEMAGKIKSAFKSWVWTDSERAAALVETYNDRFNNIAGRRFDGSHLTLPGVSLRFKMHAHQLRAIWRQIVSGNTYLAHAVGAGKTIEMIAGAMEQKRLGLIRKPMFVVPNHMLEQFANEFMELYPLANIMVADDKNFSAERRKEFTAAAALNNPDAIVITQSAFERVGVKEESIKPIRDEILDDLEDELDRTAKDNDSRVRRSQLEQQIEATKQRFDSILSAGKKDNVIPFEDLGVDMLYVDEAHAYRKLDFHTAQQIKGIDPNGSRRALDMYVKTRVLDRARPGRSFVFASGTPVTNTMGELYTVMRFFAPDTLDRDGTATFDSWARAYGDVVPALEQNASGKYEVVDRFARFENVPELMARVRQFMDVLQSEHLGAVVERPDIEGGKPQLIIVEPTAALKQYQEGPLSMRLATSRAWKPSFNQPNNPDPVLAIITDGRFAATDPRFIPGGEVRPGETTKMDRAADEIIAEYRATSGNVYVDRDGKPMPVKGGTQIVFYNVGFGAAAGKKRGFDARAAFTRRLVAGGIARDQIAWFDDADTDAKKEAIFKAMRAGTLRVLIGSAKKMGTGVNVQNRLTALHYMDPPWYPSDVEQPHGRIIRQRNQNKVVRIKWYATKGGYDATMWQMVGRKQRFIDQAFSGDKTLRSMDDLGESSQYEQAAALASGDPRALQLAGLRQDVERLERLHSAHANEQIKAKSALAEAERGEKHAASRIEIYRQMLKVIGGEHFTFKGGSVGRQSFDRYGEFGDAVKVAFNNLVREEASSPTQDEHQLATVGNGLKIIAIHDWQPGNDKEVGVRRLMPTGWFDVSVDVAGRSLSVGRYRGMGEDVDGTGLTRRIVNVINSVDADLRAAESERQSRKEDVARLRKKVGAPFEHYAEMLDKHAALKELEEELRNEGAAAAQQAAAEVQPEGDTPGTGPETRFSRGAAVATPGTRGMPLAQVQRIVDSVRRSLRIGEGVRIRVLASADEFGAPQGFRTSGLVDADGTVYVFADANDSPAEVRSTLAHELIGHLGIDRVVGDGWSQLRSQLERGADRDAGLRRLFDRVRAEEAADLSPDDVAQEVIARAAEEWGVKGPPIWRRVLGMLRAGLAKVGLIDDSVTLNDVARLVAKARRQMATEFSGTAAGDVRYRRAAEAVDAAAPRLTDRMRDRFADWRGALLGALSRQQLVELASRLLPQAKVFEEAARQMDADKTKMQQESAVVSERWLDFARKAGQKVADALAALMHDSTTSGIDPSKPDAGKHGYRELRARFEALPPEAQALYEEVRDTYIRQREQVYEALKARIARSVVSDKARATALDQLRQHFESNEVSVYFPLARFGDYWARLEKIGEEPTFVMFERQGQQREFIRSQPVRKMLADGWSLTTGKQIRDLRSQSGPAPAFVADLAKVIEQTTGPGKQYEALMDDVWQLYLQTLPDLSMRRHQIHRQNRLGWSLDALRAFANQTSHSAGQIARIRYSDIMQDALDKARKGMQGIDTTEDRNRAADYISELDKRFEWAMNPNNSNLSQALTSLGFFFYLGASPAAGLVNLTQTAIITFPVLASRYGFARASTALSKAMADYPMSAFGDSEKAPEWMRRKRAAVKSEFGGDLGRALVEAEESGLLDKTMAHDLSGIAEGEPKGPTYRRAAAIVTGVFHHAERWNREATFLAAYRLARDNKLTHAEAVEEARRVTWESHYDYSNANRARWMQGNTAKVLLQFKQYAQNTTWLMARNFYLMTRGESAQVKQEASIKFFGVLGMTGLFAGVTGLPLYSVIMGAAQAAMALFGDDDRPDDAELALRRTLRAGLGEQGGDVLAKGLVNALTGIDIAGRTGMGELWFRDPDAELEARATYQYYLMQMLGPMASIGDSAARGIGLMADGKVMRGAEMMVPKFVRDAMKAFRYETDGATNTRGDVVLPREQIGTGGALAQALGFMPADLAEQYERNAGMKRIESQIMNRRHDLINAWAVARMAGDTEGVADATKAVRKFNAENREVPISAETLHSSMRSRIQRSRDSEGGQYLNRRLRDRLESAAG